MEGVEFAGEEWAEAMADAYMRERERGMSPQDFLGIVDVEVSKAREAMCALIIERLESVADGKGGGK